MTTLTELLDAVPQVTDHAWRRKDGTRPVKRGNPAGVRPPKRNKTGTPYARLGGRAAHPAERVLPRATFDDYAAIATFDALSARRMMRAGMRELVFERGELPQGVRVWVR